MKNRGLFWLLILGLLAAGGVTYMLTRGFRNNNPGNLRAGIPWVGIIGADADGYAVFDKPENGIRAMGLDLLTKIGRGVNTPRSIISVYAPPSDNNPTDNYIAQVCEWTGFSPDQVLTRADMPTLAYAMIRFENGTTAPDADFNAGMTMALNA
jgi:hypothetical protein